MTLITIIIISTAVCQTNSAIHQAHNTPEAHLFGLAAQIMPSHGPANALDESGRLQWPNYLFDKLDGNSCVRSQLRSGNRRFPVI